VVRMDITDLHVGGSSLVVVGSAVFLHVLGVRAT
jgi:hypothetical protein